MTLHPDRRTLVQSAAVAGVAAWVGAANWSRARAAERPRLAVITLQGGMDGLSLAPPLRDERYHELRGGLAIAKPLPFTADFGLHPAMPKLAAMAKAGEVRLAPAAASPSRSRSHERESEVLAAGVVAAGDARGGWLNRAVAALAAGGGGASGQALDVAAPLLASGPAPFPAWAPGAPDIDPRLMGRLKRLYGDDPGLQALRADAGRLQRRTALAADGAGGSELAVRARTLGRLLAADDSPTVGSLSTGGYDTHGGQGAEQGRLADRFRDLDEALAALKAGAGPAWSRTAVLVFTEFGRTAAANGAGGTDHGVASAALLLGGAVRGGAILGDWPTLAASRLYEGRDLAPGLDLYVLFKGVLAEHMGLDRTVLDRDVFPGSTTAPALRGLSS